MIERIFPATEDQLEPVQSFIDGELEQYDCPPKAQIQLAVAVEEIFINIVRYAYHPEVGLATVRCSVGGDPLQVTIQFLDNGKPFNPLEVIARVKSQLRRYTSLGGKSGGGNDNPSLLTNGGIAMDDGAKSVTVDGESVSLTPIEYKLLCVLAKNTGKVLTHNYILKEVRGTALAADIPSLRVFMATLRKKIERDPSAPRYIQTHIGVGYRMIRQ